MKNQYIISILLLTLTLTGLIYFQPKDTFDLGAYFPKLSIHSSLQSKNSTWNVYKNERLGFTISVPKKYFALNGACEDENQSYIVTAGWVPTVVFEDENSVLFDKGYYATTYSDQLLTSDDQIRKTFHACKLIPQDWSEVFRDVNLWWLSFADIASENELTQFIKQQYGSSCSLGDMLLSTTQKGVHDVLVEGDGLDLGETECPVNYAYKIKYFPEQQKVMSVKLGQEGHYLATNPDTNLGGEYIYFDNEMISSFRFIEK